MKNKACCERFLDLGGMKYIFPLLTPSGVKKVFPNKNSSSKKKKKKDISSDQRSLEENAISIIAQLCSLLCNRYFHIYI